MRLHPSALLLAACLVAQAQTRPLVDMKGRSVQIPSHIHRIYANGPDASNILLAVAPDLLAGLVMPIKEEDKPFLSPAVKRLPVIGGRYGGGNTTNLEVLLRSRPDLMLLWAEREHAFTQDPEDLRKLGIPGVYAVLDNVKGYPAVFRFLGRAVGRERRCEQLAAYAEQTFKRVQDTMKRIPPQKRPRVYYAEGPDGLSTECNDSIHAELLKVSGECNVHRCHVSGPMGLEKISLEQVLLYNPDVLIVQDETFYYRVWSDPSWRRVKAVRDGRIYLAPHRPFNWLDRPPTFMRILGVQWLMHSLYPKEYPIDIVGEARRFYALFLGAQVSEAQMRKVIYRR